MSKAQKLLFIDIETYPALIASWSLRSPDASAVWVERDTFILCFSAQWSHEKKVRVHALPDYKRYKKDRYSDKSLCKELFNYLDEADVVCAHNGDRFDVPKIMGRIWVNGLRQPSPFRQLDTYKISKRFGLDSHKLDAMCRQKGIGRKLANTGAALWQGCGRGDPKAWATMREYCAHDTELLGQIAPELIPWMKTNPRLFDEGCPACGSAEIHRRGRVRETMKFQFNCQACGHWWTAKET